MEYSSECGMSVRQVMKRTVVTSTTTTSSGIESDRGNRSLVEMTTKQAPGFPRHDVKMFARDEFSTMSSGSFSNGRNSYGSVYERSFTTKTIGGGGESRRFIEHITKPSGGGDEHPIVLVRKERSQIDLPEWMRERKSPNAERRGVDLFNVNVFLKYPSGYSLSKRKPEADGVNENKIRPEVAKRDKTEIPMIPDDEEEEEEHITKPSDRGDEHPIVLVRKERSQIDVPEWMEERKSPNAERRGVDISNLKVFLKYPSGYSLRKRKPEADRVNESKIRPEVAKRDKTEIPMIPDDEEEEEEHITKPSDRGDEHPIVLVRKERSQIDVPEWMEERKSPNAERRGVDISNLKAFLKYPSGYSLRKRKPEADRVNESKIRPEVAKRDKTEIPMILDDDDEEEEESDEEYDEFEEEIVIVDIRRKPIWRKGLEIPKPQPQKAGVPIEDLLEIPTLKAKQESAPDKSIDEKIDSTERPPVVFAELPDFGVLENL